MEMENPLVTAAPTVSYWKSRRTDGHGHIKQVVQETEKNMDIWSSLFCELHKTWSVRSPSHSPHRSLFGSCAERSTPSSGPPGSVDGQQRGAVCGRRWGRWGFWQCYIFKIYLSLSKCSSVLDKLLLLSIDLITVFPLRWLSNICNPEGSILLNISYDLHNFMGFLWNTVLKCFLLQHWFVNYSEEFWINIRFMHVCGIKMDYGYITVKFYQWIYTYYFNIISAYFIMNTLKQ